MQVVPCEHDEAEAESVVMRLQAHRFERRTKFSDYAILYRGNHQARTFEQALRKEKIPYVLSGGQSFFERAEIRDLMAYLRLLANDDDDPAFIRAITTPKRGVGTTTLQALGTYAGERHVSMFAALFESGAEQRSARRAGGVARVRQLRQRIGWRAAKESAAQVLDDLLKAIDYRRTATADDKVAAARWQNVSTRRLAEEARRRRRLDARAARQTVSLLSQLDRKDGEVDAVRLAIHAEGLEFHSSSGRRGPAAAHGGRGVAEESGGDEDGADALRARPARRAGSQRRDDDARAAPVSADAARIEETTPDVRRSRAQRSLTTWCRERSAGARVRAVAVAVPRREMQLDARPTGER